MNTNAELEMVVAHFIVSNDVERSRRFYTDVLGGRTVVRGERATRGQEARAVRRQRICVMGAPPTGSLV